MQTATLLGAVTNMKSKTSIDQPTILLVKLMGCGPNKTGLMIHSFSTSTQSLDQKALIKMSVVQITAEKICGSSANYTFLPGPGQDQAGWWLWWCGGVLIINCIPAVALRAARTGPGTGSGGTPPSNYHSRFRFAQGETGVHIILSFSNT